MIGNPWGTSRHDSLFPVISLQMSLVWPRLGMLGETQSQCLIDRVLPIAVWYN